MSDAVQPDRVADQRPRKPYTPPRLEVVGHVRDIVLGSIGTFPESGASFFPG